ncbi:MAG: hypothetical protein Q4G40_09965 [Brachybacterium sp.]|nr:hypothetical protein [Brachybacterium sp.]
MADFWGADPEQLRGLRTLMENRSTTLAELQTRLDTVILREDSWTGPDGQAFREAWSAGAAPQLQTQAEQMVRLGGDLEIHAQEQEDASAVQDGGGGTAPPVTGTAESRRGLLGLLAEGYSGIQAVFTRGKKVWDTIAAFSQVNKNFWGSFTAAWDARRFGFLPSGSVFMDHLRRMGAPFSDLAFDAGREYSRMATKFANQLNIPSGFGTKNFFGHLDDLASRSSFLRTVAPVVGKALPVVDIVTGGMQFADGIRNGDTFDQVVGGVSMTGGALMLAGGALSATGIGAVVGGPLMVVGGVLSLGAAGANLGRYIHDNWSDISSRASDAWNATTSAVSTVGNKLVDAGSTVVNAAGEGLSNIGDAITGGLKNAFSW